MSFSNWLFHKPNCHVVLTSASTFLFETQLFAWFWLLREFYRSPEIQISCEIFPWFLTTIACKPATPQHMTGSEPKCPPGQFYLSFRYIYCELALWEGARGSPLRACPPTGVCVLRTWHRRMSSLTKRKACVGADWKHFHLAFHSIRDLINLICPNGKYF